MTKLDIQPLVSDTKFGARVSGVTLDNVREAAIRKQLNDLFEEKGLIVFEDMEPSAEMQVELSNVFGPLKDHPNKGVARVDQKSYPGVIDMTCAPHEKGAVEIDHKVLLNWLPWHFDHCYNNELNRAGVLRAIDTPPEGGLTGFVDGIVLHHAISPELREKIEDRNIIYRMNVIMSTFRFGRPECFKVISEKDVVGAVQEAARDVPRAVHPAVWMRQTGEKVLHVSPWMAEGIEGEETPEGDALLDAVCREIFEKARDVAYYHQWKPTDMLIWDNWRVLHGVEGHDPKYSRKMQRTTIKGDYGLGYFEGGQTASEATEMSY